MKAMILAAGFGKRMLPLTKNIPKPLITVNNKLLIEYSLINLKKSGINDIVINLHYFTEQVKTVLGNGSKWGVKIVYSEEKILLDTGGAIVRALNNNLLGKDPFIVVSADLITDFNFNLLKLKSNKLAHLLLVPNPKYKIQGDFSIQNSCLDFIVPNKTSYTYANIGIFEPKFFAGFTEGIVPLVKFINEGIKQKQITAEVYHGLWKNVGTLKELKKVNSLQI